ncbi:Signal recognition particle receptor, alpha subunit [Pseudoloma neurophilia]|uniref:Signal recognition particle receptor, alpha subunit n=1 Tax=Pseudoloma neurophilia TaxID=146866 RepID=A0A0R0LTF6_9MICR|nr:Signal recognition particle receptor, alpha subunit [Pseudoloma neurophilia]
MSYELRFTKHGNVLFEQGSEPSFLKNYLEKLRDETAINRNDTVINRNETVQGLNVKVWSVDNEVVLMVDNQDKSDNNLKKNNLRTGSDHRKDHKKDNKDHSKDNKDHSKDIKDHSKKNNDKDHKDKNKKTGRKWLGDVSQLDYSSREKVPSESSDEEVHAIDNLFSENNTSFFQRIKKTLSIFKNNSLKNKNENTLLTKLELKQLTESLIEKNVSSDIVNHILSDIKNLKELKQKLKNILKIKTINLNKKRKFALVGPNGVGKSSTLSKLCLLFLNQSKSVYVAACDTFRAGAIEQLSLYVEKLKKLNKKITLHQEGYNKEEAKVAKNAFKHSTNYDVMLCDTAGRINNKNLLDSLRKLCNLPFDEIFYVNEALKGGTTDIKEWDFITGIIVTKLDTVDEKIGALLNYTFYSDKPLVFLCYGQSNMDIEVPNVENIIDTLIYS